METLRATFESLGFENVKSYINSGNLAFNVTSPQVCNGKSVDVELSSIIHDAIVRDFGFDISVMVRSIAEIEEIIVNNPFEGQFESHKDVHVFFLNEKLSAEQEALLLAQGNENEIFAIFERYIVCLLNIHILDSSVGKGFIDKKLKVAATARNWRTVKNITTL